MPQHYYIDTDYLYSYLFLREFKLKSFLPKKTIELEKVRCANFKDIIFNKNKDVFVKVPFIVFGELFNNINNHNNDFDDKCVHYLNNELFSLFEKDNVDLIPPNKKCYKIADDILKKDSRFDSTDALIVSQALSDKDSLYMATFDNTITTSFGGGIISKINNEMYDNGEREKKLKIYG